MQTQITQYFIIILLLLSKLLLKPSLCFRSSDIPCTPSLGAGGKERGLLVPGAGDKEVVGPNGRQEEGLGKILIFVCGRTTKRERGMNSVLLSY